MVHKVVTKVKVVDIMPCSNAMPYIMAKRKQPAGYRLHESHHHHHHQQRTQRANHFSEGLPDTHISSRIQCVVVCSEVAPVTP